MHISGILTDALQSELKQQLVESMPLSANLVTSLQENTSADLITNDLSQTVLEIPAPKSNETPTLTHSILPKSSKNKKRLDAFFHALQTRSKISYHE